MQAAAFGSSCALPAAFRVCVHLLSKELPFEDAVRENIMAGVHFFFLPFEDAVRENIMAGVASFDTN